MEIKTLTIFCFQVSLIFLLNKLSYNLAVFIFIMNCFYVVIQNVHGIMAYLDISSSGNLSDPSRVDLNTNIINQSKNCNSIKGHTTVKSAKIKILHIGSFYKNLMLPFLHCKQLGEPVFAQLVYQSLEHMC